MNGDIVDEIKQGFSSGGNWPYNTEKHQFEQNPFADTWPGAQVFAGHEQELRKLQENIQRNIHTFIAGPFGVGKTVLTKTMYEILEDIEGYRPVFVPVEKGRYSKSMAEKILNELNVDFDSSSSRSDLFDLITGKLAKLRQQGCRAIFFYDEVVNGSDGTLRSILHLQRDINNWEPVLILNGTTHTMDQVRSDISPLFDRIGDIVYLDPLDFESTENFINKRLRFYCLNSEWNGAGCAHDADSTAPISPDAIDLLYNDLTAFPRHLRHELNNLMEHGARNNLQEINYTVAESVLSESAHAKVQRIPEEEIAILDWLEESGPTSVNRVSDNFDRSSYNIREDVNNLEREGLVRATKSGRGIQYKTTAHGRKALSSQMES
jgi:predicted transcriptional regulator